MLITEGIQVITFPQCGPRPSWRQSAVEAISLMSGWISVEEMYPPTSFPTTHTHTSCLYMFLASPLFLYTCDFLTSWQWGPSNSWGSLVRSLRNVSNYKCDNSSHCFHGEVPTVLFGQLFISAEWHPYSMKLNLSFSLTLPLATCWMSLPFSFLCIFRRIIITQPIRGSPWVLETLSYLLL